MPKLAPRGPLDALLIPNAAKLILSEVSSAHSAYFFVDHVLDHLPKKEMLVKAYQGIESACYVASLTSLRAFDEFFRGNSREDSDLKLSDFPGFSTTYNPMSEDDRSRINKQISHLTTNNLNGNNGAHPYRELLRAVNQPIVDFCDYVAVTFKNNADLVGFAYSIKQECQTVKEKYIDDTEPRPRLRTAQDHCMPEGG